MTQDEERFVNQLAQGIVALDVGVGWFHGLTVDEKRAVLRSVAVMFGAAGAHSGDVDGWDGARKGAVGVVSVTP